MAPGCHQGLTYGVDILVDARGPSPGDIISGTVQGCSCTVQSSKLDYTKIGFSLLLVGVLVGRRLRKRRG